MFIRHFSDKQKTRYLEYRNTTITRIGLFVCFGVLLSIYGYGNRTTAFGSIPKVSFVNKEYRILPEEEYLKLQDDEIDIATGSLIIAKGLYPDIDIKKYLNQIDNMAKELEPKLKTCKNPSEIVRTISRYLFVEQKLKCDDDKPFINNVLDEKYGQCLSFSCLYLSITERLQLPFYVVYIQQDLKVIYYMGNPLFQLFLTSRHPTPEQTL